MPIFSRGIIANVSAAQLHPSWRPGASVLELALNGRAARAMESLGIQTVGDLLLIPAQRLLDQWGFGPTTLNAVYAELRRLLLGADKGEGVDLSSFSALVRSLIGMTTADARDIDVLEKRLGLAEGGVWSLSKLGHKYGVTRERIRQIEQTGLETMSQRSRRTVLVDFWDDVFGVIDAAPGRRCDLAYLALELTRRYNWSAAPNLRVFGRIIQLRREVIVDFRGMTVARW